MNPQSLTKGSLVDGPLVLFGGRLIAKELLVMQGCRVDLPEPTCRKLTGTPILNHTQQGCVLF